jgi:hypothetical protein
MFQADPDAERAVAPETSEGEPTGMLAIVKSLREIQATPVTPIRPVWGSDDAMIMAQGRSSYRSVCPEVR